MAYSIIYGELSHSCIKIAVNNSMMLFTAILI